MRYTIKQVDALIDAVFETRGCLSREHTPFVYSFPTQLAKVQLYVEWADKYVHVLKEIDPQAEIYKRTVDILREDRFDLKKHIQDTKRFFHHYLTSEENRSYFRYEMAPQTKDLSMLFLRLYHLSKHGIPEKERNDINLKISWSYIDKVLKEHDLTNYFKKAEKQKDAYTLEVASDFIHTVVFDSSGFGLNLDVTVYIREDIGINFSSFWGTNSSIIHHTEEERDAYFLQTLLTIQCINDFMEKDNAIKTH